MERVHRKLLNIEKFLILARERAQKEKILKFGGGTKSGGTTAQRLHGHCVNAELLSVGSLTWIHILLNFLTLFCVREHSPRI